MVDHLALEIQQSPQLQTSARLPSLAASISSILASLPFDWSAVQLLEFDNPVEGA
jgi:hypothetical protein